jgi:tetratricopeptide (TPR) repeat protein
MFYEFLAAESPDILDAISICSVPLRFTRGMVINLLDRFASNIDMERFWQLLSEFGLAIQRDEVEWRLERQAREYFLTQLEQQNPTLAQQVHAAALDHLGSAVYPTPDEDHDQLQRAYHTTPWNQEEGSALYWSSYCRMHVSNRLTMLPVLAELAASQTHWLVDYEQDIMLYRAAALYYEGPVESKHQAAELLEAILKQDASAPIALEASFLLGTLREQADRDEAIELYEQATNLKDALDLANQDSDVQRHLRLTLHKSFSNLASTLQVRGSPQDLDKAELCYRRGIQIVSMVEPGYEATQLRNLVEVLQKRGGEVEGPVQRISQIERPFRQEFLEGALSEFRETGDIGPLYYAISALNHGLGYDSQIIRIEVEQNGAAWLEGTYALRATSMLSHIDTYLETVPESQVGVHFESLESLTPVFNLKFNRISTKDSEAERLEVDVDPPMEPGDQLTYRWTARSSPGTFATTLQQLEKAGLDYEYAAWDIIAPMRQLQIQVLIPVAQMPPPPPTWFELWRVGNWHAAAQAQTAYRAFLGDDPSRVRWHVEVKPPGKVQLRMEVDYPWLAMRYVLAWEVVD